MPCWDWANQPALANSVVGCIVTNDNGDPKKHGLSWLVREPFTLGDVHVAVDFSKLFKILPTLVTSLFIEDIG
jgi:hypothetical protein